MRQCPDSYLRHAIRWPLARANRPTLKALGSSGRVRDDAIDALVAQIMERMSEWEIMIPEPQGNLFQDLTDPQREDIGLAPRPGPGQG